MNGQQAQYRQVLYGFARGNRVHLQWRKSLEYSCNGIHFAQASDCPCFRANTQHLPIRQSHIFPKDGSQCLHHSPSRYVCIRPHDTTTPSEHASTTFTCSGINVCHRQPTSYFLPLHPPLHPHLHSPLHLQCSKLITRRCKSLSSR